MPWFKVDDNLAFHQKTLRAGNAAIGLWTRAGSWCAQQLTDGFIPLEMARTLGTKAEAERLVAVRLWLERDGGYEFWQWNEDGRQPTRVEVETKRKDARERQRRARELRAASRSDRGRDSSLNVTRDATVTHASPDPTRPDPTRPVVPNGTTKVEARGARLPDDWRPSEELIEWQRQQRIPDATARRELPKFRDYWTAQPGQRGVKRDWGATWRNWLRTTAERESPTPTKTFDEFS